MEKNLETAADVYISKCNNAPFQESKITLFIRSKDELAKNIQERRPHQKTFLKGSQKKRQLLKESNQTQYKYFEDIWKLRGRNMVKGLPSIITCSICYRATRMGVLIVHVELVNQPKRTVRLF